MDTQEQLIHTLLGKTVHVVVDRPMGSCHKGTVYPVNYGYIPGVIAGDGEAQDAYILGVPHPIVSFDGQVIGAIRRKNDCEDKLVVAPEGLLLHQGEIAAAVHFQEQYFDTAIDSLFRKSCGVIPYRETGGRREYLVLLQNNRSWSFPKGHMEAGENELQTALRELAEETGLRAVLDPAAKAVSEYDIPPHVHKQVVLFLGAVSGTVTPQRSEILSYRWVCADTLCNYLHPDTYAICAPLLR